MKDVISVKDFSREWVYEVLTGAGTMMPYVQKGMPPKGLIPALAKCTLLFVEPSTRTRGSFNEAARLLGFDRDNIISSEATSLSKGESMADTARMLGKGNQGADILVMRTKLEGAARFAAEILEEEGYPTAVLNGGDGTNQHPTQALVDWMTIKTYLGRTDSFVLGIIGDLELSRVAHSDLELARLMGVKQIRLVSLPEVRVQPKYKRGFDEVIEGDSLDLLADADVVIVLRVQTERYTDPVKLSRVKGHFQITQKVLDSWKKNVIILHPLPCIDEIDVALYHDPRILIHRQAEKAIPTRMQLLLQSYKNRKIKSQKPPPKSLEAEILKKVGPIKKLALRKNKKYKYFRPIINGVILDHIPSGEGLKVRSLLKNFEKSMIAVHLIEGVPSKRYTRKDVLVLENYFPGEPFQRAISFLWPQITFNILREEIHHKVKFGLPEEIVGVFRCPNHNCITNNDPEARTRTRFSIIKERDNIFAECGYCEREFTRDEIYSALP